jgi:hypothetical protein
MSSYSDLFKKYDNKYQSNECNGWKNIVAPGRCSAAKEYRNDLKNFVNEAVKQEQQSIPNEIKLMRERIKNNDHTNIYPLINYDFDYTTAIKKELNPYKLGITNEPTFGNLVDGTAKLKNYLDYIITDPFPNNNTVAGITDTVLENKDKKTIIDLKNLEDSKLPYPRFRKDYPECLYPTKGAYASSYFIREGNCPTKITDKEKCIRSGYEWIPEKNKPSYIGKFINTYDPDKNKNIPAPDTPKPAPKPEKGNCYKPKYVYIDNKPRGKFGLNGLVPSMFNEINNIRPDKLADVMAGYSIGGAGIVPCSAEEFSNKDNEPNYSLIMLIGTVLVILYICSNK